MGSCDTLTSEERSVIIGAILGDGHLEKISSGTVRLSVQHGLAQRAYTDMLYRKLKRLVHTPPKVAWHNDRRYAEKRPSYRFRTRQHSELSRLYEIFYNSDGRKHIPRNIGTMVTPLALAVWFMDDGSYKNDSRGLLLNTMAFTECDHQILQRVLEKRFSIPTTLHVLRKWKRMYIPAKHSANFAKIINRHVPRSMQYKLQRVFANPVTTDPERVR